MPGPATRSGGGGHLPKSSFLFRRRNPRGPPFPPWGSRQGGGKRLAGRGEAGREGLAPRAAGSGPAGGVLADLRGLLRRLAGMGLQGAQGCWVSLPKEGARMRASVHCYVHGTCVSLLFSLCIALGCFPILVPGVNFIKTLRRLFDQFCIFI